MRTILFLTWIMCVTLIRAQLVTSFPSLLIHASSRGMGMGDAGIASAEGTQQLLYNPAKSAFTHYFHQLSIGYMPWLTGISDDTRMMNVGYIASVNNAAFGVSLNYLNLGAMDTRDENGATLASYQAREFNVGGSFALQLNEHHSISTTLKFLAKNSSIPDPVNTYTVCGDIGYYGYVQLGDISNKIEWGATLTNLGARKLNLPFTGGLGIAYTKQSDNSSFSVSLDASRLIYDDWKGVRYTGGLEYGFAEQFFLRCGMAFENVSKGNRKFFSFGAGYKGFVEDQSYGLDVYYLVPFGVAAAVSPFQNVYGFTLRLNLGNFQ